MSVKRWMLITLLIVALLAPSASPALAEQAFRQIGATTRVAATVASSAALRSPNQASGPATDPVFAVQTAAGTNHTCALTALGSVKCWGNNFLGQLGDGTTVNHTTPVDVAGLSGIARFIDVGGDHTCAVTEVGGAKCWGSNNRGQLGDNTTINRYTPVDVLGLSNGVTAVAGGEYHTCALTTTGGVECWGGNSAGQLGDGTSTQRLTPVAVLGLSSGVSAVVSGHEHTCGLTAAGGVKCWGANYHGQLGDGTTATRYTPVDVWGLRSGVRAIAAGYDHTCALTDAGGVKCWGHNGGGQLGDGTTTNSATPVSVSALNSGVSAVAAGNWHTCAMTEDGGAKCWGANGFGQLGDDTTTNRLTPVDVIGLSNQVDLIASGSYHNCAVTTRGGVMCWGRNWSGQLGDGTTTTRMTPVNVAGLAGGTRRYLPLVMRW